MRFKIYDVHDKPNSLSLLMNAFHLSHQTDVIILDFAKAFDKLNHAKLIGKLKAHNVDMVTEEWIGSNVLNGTSSGETSLVHPQAGDKTIQPI